MDVLPGYTTKFGNKSVVVADVAGPTYYMTGGSEIDIADLGLGLGAFDMILFSASKSGTYLAFARFPTAGAPLQTFKMIVVHTATGNEATYGVDLDGETFRGFFICV